MKMKSVIHFIRLLVVIQSIHNIDCQNEYEGHDMIQYFSLGNSELQDEPITGYSANALSKDANGVAPINLQQYQVTEAFEPDDYARSDYARTRKVFRIKNPFEHPQDEDQQSRSSSNQQENNQGSSNPYASLQYSLSSDDFIQKLKTDNNQYYQQQLSTPSSNVGYTATPLPQYQFSTVSTSSYDNNNQQLSNQIQLDPKGSQSQNFISNANSYQYSTPNTFSIENVQSTPSPYSPTPLVNNNQFIGSVSNPYVSSSLPIFLSSPQNLQPYISSPYSQTTIQSASPDYNSNRVTTTIGSNSEGYDTNDSNKRMQVEYYDNSVNGVKYPLQQYQNDYQPTTIAPLPSQYSDSMREAWQSSVNAGVNALSKSLQELSVSQYQNLAYPNNQHDFRLDNAADNFNSETHRTSKLPASNLYLNYIQSDYQSSNNQKNRPQDTTTSKENSQTEHFSNGDFGWKLGGKQNSQNLEAYANDNNIRTQYHPVQSGNSAISQVSFHMDTGKHYNYDQISKATSENADAQEFAKAVGKSQERMKQQQQFNENNYHLFNNNNQQSQSASLTNNAFHDNNDGQINKYSENSNIFTFNNNQPDLVTASPIYQINPRDEKTNSLFDHAKALKAIVPIDVSNVVGNVDSHGKNSGSDGGPRFSVFNFNKDQINHKQYSLPLADAYYRDKNAAYGFNIKTKPEDYEASENFKQLDQNSPTFLNQHHQPMDLSQNIPISFTGGSPSHSYNSQGSHRFQNQFPSDLNSIFKLNDGPYRFPQGLSSDSFRLNSNSFEQSGFSTPLTGRINQNLNSHQLDVPTLNKFGSNKQPGLSFGKPDSESFSGLLPTINGFKVANPFNVDMKLVADVLKGKPTVDETRLLPFRDQFNKASPPKIDISQLQLLLKNENNAHLTSLRDGVGSLSNTYFDVYNNDRYPYQGVKYSRSQEEEENIPITDTASNPLIGAVIDQDDTANDDDLRSGPSDGSDQDEESMTSITLDEERPKKFSASKGKGDKHRHPNAVAPIRNPHQRKHPRANEPHTLLKPPPFNKPKNRVNHNKETSNRKRRLNKPPFVRILMTEPLYEADSLSYSESAPIPILLRPPPQMAEEKSDKSTMKL